MEDQLPESELTRAFKVFEKFAKSLLDPFAVINMQGKVERSNLLLAQLLQKKTKEIYKTESFDSLLTLKIDETRLSVKNLLENDHPTRMDEIHGTVGKKVLSLIIGIFPIFYKNKKLGIFITIRDMSAEALLQDKYKIKSTQSITDQLTGLYNRHYFEQYLPSILDQMVGEGEEYSISVLMIDVDHFKSINDTHGHMAGDIILESVAKKFKEICRKSDIICRYGGEEFLIILPGADLHDSRIVAEKLRKAIENHSIEFESKKIALTISIGAAQIKVGMEKSEQAIARADRALYQAKETGRNKTLVNENGKIRD